ncbi:MAG: hypothetical protein WCP58_09720 [bacterium]
MPCWFGISLSDRWVDIIYRNLDIHFPGLRERYERAALPFSMFVAPRGGGYE